MSGTARIVAAHLRRNPMPIADLPAVIRLVHGALASLAAWPPQPQRLDPAVPLNRSVAPDYIVCLEDGKKLKMLRRHLRVAHAMTPQAYRARWGLSYDYPMVAPAYGRARSALAQRIGLGRRARRPRGGEF